MKKEFGDDMKINYEKGHQCEKYANENEGFMRASSLKGFCDATVGVE